MRPRARAASKCASRNTKRSKVPLSDSTFFARLLAHCGLRKKKDGPTPTARSRISSFFGGRSACFRASPRLPTRRADARRSHYSRRARVDRTRAHARRSRPPRAAPGGEPSEGAPGGGRCDGGGQTGGGRARRRGRGGGTERARRVHRAELHERRAREGCDRGASRETAPKARARSRRATGPSRPSSPRFSAREIHPSRSIWNPTRERHRDFHVLSPYFYRVSLPRSRLTRRPYVHATPHTFAGGLLCVRQAHAVQGRGAGDQEGLRL